MTAQTITKANAVRAVVSKDDRLTNRQIRDQVLAMYGIHVESNQIVQVVGSFRERMANSGFPSHLINRAKELLIAVNGDYRQAKRLLEMAVTR